MESDENANKTVILSPISSARITSVNVLADIRRYELLSEFANNNEDDEGDFKISSDTKKI